jgi:serine/threonine protein kinase
MRDLVGTTIERYKIINELGVGGMAVVYRAIDTMLDRNVAVKILLPEVSNKEKLLKRFSREAKTLASLSHSNIVKVLDYGEFEATPYLVLEFISGGTLSSRMGKSIHYAEAASILAPIARALTYAHQQKIVHRDIKPANILLNETGQAMLSDFGILKLMDLEESQGLTGTGKITGTPAYMSPEQIRGREIDGRSDIYSLGIVFFEMVTGRKPYVANTPIELSMQHLHDPIPKAKQFVRDLPSDVDQVFVKAMAKNPEERFQSMSAFAAALEKLAGISPTKSRSGRDASPTSEEKQYDPQEKSKINKMALLLVPLIILLGAGAFFFSQRGGAAPETTAPLVVAVIDNTATSIPATADKPLTASPTAEITAGTATPYSLQCLNTGCLPTASPIVGSPTATMPSEAVIQENNVSQIIQTNRIEGISVKKTDWMKNGKWIINAGSGKILFIDPGTVSIQEKIDLPGEVPSSMAVSQLNDRLYLLIGGNLNTYDIQTLKLISSHPVTGGTYSIAVSPDGKWIGLGISDSKVQLLNAQDGKVVQNLRSNYGGWAVAFSPDSKIIAGGTSQGVLMWEAASGLWLPLIGGQANTIKSLTFSNDGRFLAGGSQNSIFLWDVAAGDLLFQMDGNFGDVNDLDFSPDDSILLSGLEDGTVQLWSTRTGKSLKSLTGHTSPVYSVSFSPDGQKIATGANEGTILIWQIP